MSQFEFFFSTSFDFDLIEGFHLLQDHVGTKYSLPWDDYDYIVTFQVFRIHQGNREFFGRTKILVNGYKDTSKYFLKSGELTGNSHRITNLLTPENVVSLASDIDYYRRIGSLLKVHASDFLCQICDGSYYYRKQENFTRWAGFGLSLFRSSMANAMLKKGLQISCGRYEPPGKFSFTLDGVSDQIEPIEFKFDNDRPLGKTNVNLLIGRNGVGKSHALRHLVDTLMGLYNPAENWPFFHKVIAAAYSPFESFKTEVELSAALGNSTQSAGADDFRDAQERRRLLVNEYVYLGFRDPEGVFSLDWPKESSARALHRIFQHDLESQWHPATSRFKLLFDTLRSSIEFDAIILADTNNQPVVFRRDDDSQRHSAARNSNFLYTSGIQFQKGNQLVTLSSGQIIYSYLLPNLVAEVDDESLIILDEPELYLHPAMEVGLLDMLKKLLAATKSNAIIATHSSILAREVEQSGISVLRRVSDRTEVSNPGFETFGQTLEVILGLAFDDFVVRKPYEDSIDQAVKSLDSLEIALNELGPCVGDEALTYLTTKIVSESDEIKIERRESQ
ncbi:AAA family ATPase [Laribacter hongkongensis]|uniref:AAA family ATPase n=1 Tax=Laribacter hongkongensis TaxID=168471 RepID=UPI0003FA8173|nr:AAA family ATPase [Laribacter hongkongensis]